MALSMSSSWLYIVTNADTCSHSEHNVQVRNGEQWEESSAWGSHSEASAGAILSGTRPNGEQVFWLQASALKLNPNNVDELLVGSTPGPRNVSLPAWGGLGWYPHPQEKTGEQFDRSSPVRELQESPVAETAFHRLRPLCQLCPFLGMESLALVPHAPTPSRLDYACYARLPLTTVQTFLLAWSAAARWVPGMSK